jgi:iron complex outermembrane recepter protein
LPSFCGVTSNAGKATFKGVELEFNARLGENFATDGDRLNLLGAVGYIDAQFDEYISNIASVPTDVATFRQIQNTPKWTASATLAYMTPVGAGRLNLGTTLSYRSSTNQFEIPNPYIGLHGKNLTDKEYKTSGYSFIAGNATTGVPTLGGNGLPIASLGREGTLTAFYGNPRQVFVTAGLKF